MYRGLLLGLILAVAACGGRNAPNSSDGGGDGPVVKGDGPVVIKDGNPIPDGPIVVPDAPITDGEIVPPDGPIIESDGALKPDVIVQPDLGVLDNDTCARATPVPLVNGAAQITGNTQGAVNEYGTAINCGSLTTAYNGNQRYYKFSLKANTSYRFTYGTQYSSERLYIFRTCGINTINTDCASNGATGGTTTSATQTDLLFTPTADGDYIVAIDSTSAQNNAAGPFTLTVQSFVLPTNITCANAQALTFTAGKVMVTGTTAVAQNEFGTQINCGSTTQIFSAPQVYYKINATAGRTYNVTLASRFNGARFYAFAGACDPTNINSGCSSAGVTGLVSGTINNGQTDSLTFSPTTSGSYTIVVDSTTPTAVGDFDLTIEEFTPPANSTCATAQTLTLTNGKAAVKATTLGAPNEFGTQIVCNQTQGVNMAGPQVYYKVTLSAAKTYKMVFSPQYPARWYLFGNSCQVADINATCAASGIDGDLVNNTTDTRLFTPLADGTYTIAIDSRNDTNYGAFDFSIEEFAAPTNATCATAQQLTLVNGKASVTGTTFGAANEYGTQIVCNQTQGVNMAGPQVYYKVDLQANQAYKLTLSPLFPSRWYLFASACTAQAINASCATTGIDGDVVNDGDTVSRVFTPTAAGSYTIAVDSRNDNWFGDFTLSIETFTVPTNTTCATSQALTIPPAPQTTTITGDTTGSTNEYGNQINCSNFPMSPSFSGPQLYYTLALLTARTYGITFTPSYSGARLYVARANCSGQAIDGDCASNGTNGGVVALPNGQTSVTVPFKPPADGNYLLVVDGTNGSAGAFKVDIQ